jgi:hypothetical protein
MRCDVFRGIGGTAHKYYMLFQHHLAPPPSTFTSEDATTRVHADKTAGTDPNQLMDTYVGTKKEEPCYIVGHKPGPYVSEHSHSIYTRLGARIAFLGVDGRIEVGLESSYLGSRNAADI